MRFLSVNLDKLEFCGQVVVGNNLFIDMKIMKSRQIKYSYRTSKRILYFFHFQTL